MKNFISDLINFVIETEPQDKAGFVDESYGSLTSEEVIGIVMPLARQARYVSETAEASFGYKEMGLFRHTETKKLVWIVHFEWLKTKGKSMCENGYLDTIIASIKVDDETGKILSVWQKGMNSEVKYTNFLNLLEANKDEE